MLIHGPIRKIIILFFVGVQVSKIFFSIDFLCRFIEKQVLFFHLRGSVFCAFVGTHLIALCFLTDKDLCASL